MVHPAEGRAPHARRMARVCARHIPGRPPASRPHRVEMDCHGASSAFQSGRGDRAPPRKPPSAPSPGFPLRRPSHRLAILWRGGLRTPGREGIGPIQMFSPLGHQPFARPSVIMTSPGLRPARTCGRGDRAPPRKPPSAPSPGLPPLGHPSLDGPPAEGRAPHARKGRHRANPNVFSSWPPTFRAPVRNHDFPRFAPGPYLRTRRPRPSEKSASALCQGFSVRPSVLG